MGTSSEDVIGDFQVDLEFNVLPAEHGDCLLVFAKVARETTYSDFLPASRGEFRILIDTGPGAASLAALRRRLERLEPQVDGHRYIDLVVFTHLDADHIGNAVGLLQDQTLGLKFRDIWFNGYQQLIDAASAEPAMQPTLEKSFPQAEALSAVIESRGLPHNRAFEGGPAVVLPGQRWRSVLPRGARGGKGPEACPTITLLSPTNLGLSRLLIDWARHRERFERGEPDEADAPQRLEDLMLTKAVDSADPPDVDDLARVPFREDQSVPNGSSLALIIEHRDLVLLLLGDAHPSVYEESFTAWREAERPGVTPSIVKLSHHGSRKSTTAKTAQFGARNYFISTDGRFGHPDEETLARLITHAAPGTTPTFWFNYATETARRWQRLSESDDRFDVQLPSDNEDGGGMFVLRRHHG